MEHAQLLREAASQIDELDLSISHLNEDKKAIYQNIKETVPPAEFRAWREAVKLRQKRRVDRHKMEEHDCLVADMLHMLEQGGTVHAPARVQVQVRETPHDPDTGEITETDSAAASTADADAEGEAEVVPLVSPSQQKPAAGLAAATADQEGGVTAPVVPPSAIIDAGPMPAFLDRRRAGEAVQ